MDVLAEHRELLGQIAITRIGLLIAIARRDAPLGPRMKRVRAPAANRDVVARTVFDQNATQAIQIVGDVVHRRTSQGVDLDHAFSDFQLDVAVAPVVLHGAQQIRRAARQVEIARSQELKLEFDAEGQGFAPSEFENVAHITPPGPAFSVAVSPARFSAKRHRTGPAISMIAAAKNARAKADGPISGYRRAISKAMNTAVADSG